MTNMNLAQRVLNRISRIVQGPQVRDRIVVKVVDGQRREHLKPGFLIGAYRSGTTLLRYVLDSHSNIAVPPETNFLYPLADMWRSEWVKNGIRGAGIDESALLDRLREFAAGVFDDYATAKGKSRWIDKTPAYIDTLDFLDGLFGERCRYIMLYRHGLDVANSLAKSYEKKVLAGPAKEYADAYTDPPRLIFARYWAEQCEKMLAFEEAHPEQCFRIYYERYAKEPELYLPPLFEFLGEPWESDALNFNKKQHDFGLQDNKILETRTFTPSIGNYNEWNTEEIAKAYEIIKDTMKKLGYQN
ncbi:MAG: sulfotransferase [Desulfuromonadales bacterium]|nr:sulfotransferase [Desulfuromonadales bacterium]